jgi:hypothetical protein
MYKAKKIRTRDDLPTFEVGDRVRVARRGVPNYEGSGWDQDWTREANLRSDVTYTVCEISRLQNIRLTENKYFYWYSPWHFRRIRKAKKESKQ